jgi:hypothetical protein
LQPLFKGQSVREKVVRNRARERQRELPAFRWRADNAD